MNQSSLIVLLILCCLSTYSSASNKPDTLTIAVELGENRAKPESSLAKPLQIMARKLGAKVEYFYCPWARCLQAMENGNADMLDKLYMTVERQGYIEYLSPAYVSQTATFRFYSHKDQEVSIRSIDDLHGKVIGVVRAAVYFPDFDYDSRIKKVAHIHLSNVIELAAAKRIHALIAAPEFTTEVIHSYPKGDLLAQQPFEYEYARGMYIGLSKKSDWYPFVDHFNGLLKEAVEELDAMEAQ